MASLSAVLAAFALGCLAAAEFLGTALGREQPREAGGRGGADARQLQRVTCKTTTGDFVIEVHPEWAPLGAARFLELVQTGFFTDSPLFRVKKKFLVQFGIASTPEVTERWRKKGPILDDPNIGISVKRGTMAFAGGGKDSRTTEMWIAYRDSKSLGNAFWETPFAEVVEGMENVDKFYDGYGDMKAFGGNAPDQRILYKEGIAYTKKEYPELSYILACDVVPLSAGERRAAEPPKLESPAKAVEKQAPIPNSGTELGHGGATEEDRGLEDLHHLTKVLNRQHTEHKPLLSTTASIGLMSFVVVFVVVCVRMGTAEVSANKGTPVKDR